MEKELATLKKMLADAHTMIRGHKGTTWPRFGIEMFLLHAIIQANVCINLLPKQVANDSQPEKK